MREGAGAVRYRVGYAPGGLGRPRKWSTISWVFVAGAATSAPPGTPNCDRRLGPGTRVWTSINAGFAGDATLIAILDQADLDAGRHVTIHRLAVHPSHTCSRSLALATNPQSQHFPEFVHRHLPEHRHLAGSLADGGEFNGGETSAGGPSQVAP